MGDAVIPGGVWDAMRRGTNIELVAPHERRIDVLIEDYLAHEANRAPLRAQLAQVEERMEQRAPLLELFDAGRDRELVGILLDRYYDPLYRHSERGQRYAVSIDATDPGAAAAEVASWIEARA